ncbi:MAG: hypothetical protein NTAFB01_41290 [Nitrospira sp.]
MKLNEYGIFRGVKPVAGRTEQEVYKSVGLPYIEPELREERGEIETAKQHRLPILLTVNDIRGDLHTHTKATDGLSTIKEMAEAARKKGYEYLAITDHTQHVTAAHGLDVTRLSKHIEEIDRIRESVTGLYLLKSAEVDILEDGSLDLPDEILRKLDLTVCAVHSHFHLSRNKQTERIIRAMDNPYFTIFAHPTGRLLGERQSYELDLERIIKAALERRCFLELNAQPLRLDLSDVHCRLAKEMGLKLVISSDAHSATELDYMRFGVAQARRGWLEAENVLNTKSWKDLKNLIRRA